MRQTCPTNILALGGGKISWVKPQKFGAVGAVLKKFGQIFEKSSLKMLKNQFWLKNLDSQKIFRIPFVNRPENKFIVGH